MSSLHQDDMSESGEMPMPETREPRKARPSRVSARVSRVGRKSVHSEFGEATVAGQAEDGWDGPCWKHTRSGPQIHQL